MDYASMSWNNPTLVAVGALVVSIVAAIFTGIQAKEARRARECNEKALQSQEADTKKALELAERNADAVRQSVEALNLLVGAISRLNTN